MSIEVRPATAGEMGQLGWLTSYAYGGSFGDGPDNVPATANRPEWTLCAFDDGRMVASYGAIPFTMRANGNAVSMAGVTAVATAPEYRRRGIVRRIVTKSFEDMRENGQAVAALWASQAAIYQRYQYSMTSVLRRYSVDTVDVAFFDGDTGSASVARTPVVDGLDQCREIYKAFIADRTGYLHRARVLWFNNVLADVAEDGPVQMAICRDADGQPVGYAIYTLRSSRVNHEARSQEIKVRDLAWLTPDAYRSLWAFLAQHDLVGRIVWETAPLDDPAPELFQEPRMLRAEDREGVWLRVVDAARALEGRGYDRAGTLSIGIHPDPATPWNDGVVVLDASPDGARVSAGSGDPDISVTLKALASLYTGFRTARELARLGAISGATDAVLRAEALFATRSAPHCPDHF